MVLKEKDLALLEAYHDGTLRAEEVLALKNRIDTESDFRSAVKEWETLWILSTQPTVEEKQTTQKSKIFLQYLEKKEPHIHKKGKNIFIKFWWLILILLALISWKIINKTSAIETKNNEPTPRFQAFDDHYFKHLPRDGANLGSTSETGKANYDSKDYSNAWPALVQNIETSQDSILLLYAGVAALADQHSSKAILYLKSLLNSPNFIFYRDDIQWYLALAYLENGNIEKGKKVLRKIITDQTVYQTDALQLLQEIQ